MPLLLLLPRRSLAKSHFFDAIEGLSLALAFRAPHSRANERCHKTRRPVRLTVYHVVIPSLHVPGPGHRDGQRPSPDPWPVRHTHLRAHTVL